MIEVVEEDQCIIATDHESAIQSTTRNATRQRGNVRREGEEEREQQTQRRVR